MKKYWSMNFTKALEYGYTLIAVESDFLGITYRFYFVPLSSSSASNLFEFKRWLDSNSTYVSLHEKYKTYDHVVIAEVSV